MLRVLVTQEFIEEYSYYGLYHSFYTVFNINFFNSIYNEYI